MLNKMMHKNCSLIFLIVPEFLKKKNFKWQTSKKFSSSQNKTLYKFVMNSNGPSPIFKDEFNIKSIMIAVPEKQNKSPTVPGSLMNDLIKYASENFRDMK